MECAIFCCFYLYNATKSLLSTPIWITIKQKKHMMQAVLLYGVPALCAVVCYVNSLYGELVYDDVPAIVDNRDVTAQTDVWTLLRDDYWGKPMWDNSSHKSYRPLTVATFR